MSFLSMFFSFNENLIWNYFLKNFTVCEFLTWANAGGLYSSLSDSKSCQFSRTLLSILANINYAVVCMVLIRPLVCNFNSLFSKPLRIFPSPSIVNSITVTLIQKAFSSHWQDSSIFLSFGFLSFLLCGLLKQQNPHDDMFLLLVN